MNIKTVSCVLILGLVTFSCQPGKTQNHNTQTNGQPEAAENSPVEQSPSQPIENKAKASESAKKEKSETETKVITPPDEYQVHYTLLNSVLRSVVSNSERQGIRTALVNYAAVSNNADFLKVFNWYQNAPIPETYAAKYAFWLNAYNVYTMKLMSEKSNGQSIMKIDNGTAFDKQYYSIAGKPISLNQIEKGIVKSMGRVDYHFALVCAALSCPDLARSAYTEKNVFWLMKEQARKFFLNETKGVRIDDASSTVYVSTLGQWYGEEFTKKGSFLEYAAQFFDESKAQKILTYKVEYIPYNWSPNGL